MILMYSFDLVYPSNIDKWQFGVNGFLPISDIQVTIPNVYEQITFWIG